MQLYVLQEHGRRALCLVDSTHALLFRQPPKGTSKASVSLAFQPVSEVSLARAQRLSVIQGCLGLIHLNHETFLVAVTRSATLGNIGPSESVDKILAVSCFCLTSAVYDATFMGAAGYEAPETDDESLSLDYAGAAVTPEREEDPTTGLRRILSNGSFYTSPNFDLSSRLQKRSHEASVKGKARASGPVYDERFLWNSFLADSLLAFRDSLSLAEQAQFDAARFVLLAIQGYVGISQVVLANQKTTLALISRLGSKRAGTRYNARGIDDDGYVANFVESETLLRSGETTYSFVQVRGSVPLFWEQQALQLQNIGAGQSVQITRPAASSQPAFERHFDDLLHEYHSIQAVNLMSARGGHETMLSRAYSEHLARAKARPGFGDVRQIGLTEYDFHNRVKLDGIEYQRTALSREPGVAGNLDRFGFTLEDAGGTSSHLTSEQSGTFRTNCLDCLDRTNVVEDILSRLMLEHYLSNAFPGAPSENLWNVHRTLWAENGDALSKLYAGTGAINTSFTRSGKKTLSGLLSDATKSVSRLYIGNFVDKGKQQSIDSLLGNLDGQEQVIVFNPARDQVNAQMNARRAEYSSSVPITIAACTWNLNGRPPSTEDLLPWLMPGGVEPDVIAVGFQEIVQLSPQQIMATDPSKLHRWEKHILTMLTQRSDKTTKYELVRSEQLVGAALLLIVKTTLVGELTRVEASTHKTGLKGLAGNKGAVAIRFELKDSSFCFVTAHFAAGSNNVDERNQDYWTITNELTFTRGKRISSHDNIVFSGDFNYRVSLPFEQARQLCDAGDLTALLDADQLREATRARRIFPGFVEAPIAFLPTYKYDVGTDRYDTSEKQRVPSWTDRVLVCGSDLDVNVYARTELLTSDHRPVHALLRGKVRVIDAARKQTLYDTLIVSVSTALPRPSTEEQQWWSPGAVSAQECATLLQKPMAKPPIPVKRLLPSSTLPTPVRRKPPPSEVTNSQRAAPALPPRPENTI
ncbi:uncharacterized protein L969DRAFT_17015 [Mixia osmundae IAM 14324]|uniref:phosphoinositide 5-phosphatase n=1 Tax=Mixia osmundae (strain CBS 9802 / IAM 14324 / JCM 22182 / KY 12970) TaxID=764103 RepID=G7EA10_MIXOS|nr:uncharacterized protein L969DRAFT_17015 [Mixia osmundae IAM 14324]KEI40357.1 hypothetical protein L969DRAFT_17015 [Mixia osmundae IAM 14324]GAA99670.1 hypothetical protein E5Q_06373 [Mixia osmundae IAM 14324]